MRLIDADKLIGYCNSIRNDEWNNKISPISWAEAYESFIEDVENQPVIEKESEVKAKWIPTGDWEFIEETYPCKCSKCGEVTMVDFGDYCPYCGVRMEEI